MTNPWAFGWTQLLTIIGIVVTVSIAVGGFRTFNRWKREKLEEKKIEVAYEALSIAYELKYVFQYIDRRQQGFSSVGSTPDKDNWQKRLQDSHEYFERVWKVQAKCMAFFGAEIEETFTALHVALAHFESRNSYYDAHPGNRGYSAESVARAAEEFRGRIENFCRPVVDGQFKSVQLGPPEFRLRRGGRHRVRTPRVPSPVPTDDKSP